MSDIVFVSFTAVGCGHCEQLRGAGVLGDGKHFNTYKFLIEYLNIMKTNILNIHFNNMRGMRSNIKEVCKFSLSNKEVIQEKYYSLDGKTAVSVSSINAKEKIRKPKVSLVKINNQEIDWNSFLIKKIPQGIENYTYFFPCFVVFKKADWAKGKNPLGITNAGFTQRDKEGNYGLEKNAQTLGQRSVTPIELLKTARNGILKFQPHKDLFEKVEKKAPPIVKQKKDCDFDFVLKGYDDE